MVRSKSVAQHKDALRTLIVGQSGGGASRAHGIVAAIEDDLFARGWPDGMTLGTLPELQQRLGVGRPVCLEAATIMQTRRMIDIKRGQGGGIYVARPDLSSVAHAFLLSLMASGTRGRSLNEMRRVALRLSLEEAMRAPGEFVPLDGSSYATSRTFRLALAAKSANPGIGFATAIVEELHEGAASYDSGGWSDEAKDLAGELAEAVRRGDDEAAGRLENRLAAADSPIANGDLIVQATTASANCLNSRKYAGSVAEKILREIVTHDERPVRLASERALTERFGFDAHVVRQALRVLEDLGCIELRRGRSGGLVGFTPPYGAMIRRIAPCIARLELSHPQSVGLAGALAVQAVGLAAERAQKGECDLPALDQFTDRLKSAGPDRAVSAYVWVENRLADLAANPILCTLLRAFALSSMFQKVQPPSMEFTREQAETITGYNLRIVAAIRAGDPSTAKHLAGEKDRLMQGD